MGNLSLRRLIDRVLPGRFGGRTRRQPRGVAGRTGRARTLELELLEDRSLLSPLQAISLPPAGQPPSDTAAGTSLFPAVSADGRYVAFESSAPNLVPGQTGGTPNVFLLDRTTRALTLVSHLAGQLAAGSGTASGQPLLSRDGRYVVYTGDYFGNGGGPGPGVIPYGVVVYDRTTGQSTLVSPSSGSVPPPIATLDALSGNGRYIVYEVQNFRGTADSDNLYLYDQVTRTTYLVTHAAGRNDVPEGFNAGAPIGEGDVAVADDGTVAYLDQDAGGNLVSGVTGIAGDTNVYVYTPADQANRLVSAGAGSSGTQAAGQCTALALSEDGSTVAFVSRAADLVANQDPTRSGIADVFRYGVAPQALALVSGSGGSATVGGNADSGTVGNFPLGALAVTPDGRYVAFFSQATDLVGGQTGAAGNVFLADAQGPGPALLSGVGGSPTAGAGGSGTSLFNPTGLSLGPPFLSVSDDGGEVAFLSQANNLVPGQTGAAGTTNLFLYSRAAGHASLVTAARGTATAADAGPSNFPALSGDGSLLAFDSLAADLVAGTFDGNGVADVFTYSPGGGGPALVSRAAFPQLAPGDSFSTSVSGDGRYTAFTSTAQDLVPNQVTVNSNQNVFLYDKQAGTVTLVNHAPNLPDTTGNGGLPHNPVVTSPFDSGGRPDVADSPAISADGSTVAFVSTDTNLVPGQQPAGPLGDLYLYDVATGTIKSVNHTLDANPISSIVPAQEPAIDADGSYVAFLLGFGLPPAGAPPSGNLDQGALALYDTARGAITLLTPLDDQGNGTASNPSISDDGRFVSYLDHDQVYVYDRVTGTTVLASHDNSAPTSTTAANGASSAPVISHDGGAVAFVSAATNLVPGQAAGAFTNVFLYRNDTSGGDAVGPVLLVSGAGGSPTTGGAGNSDSPAIDADGSYVAYRSDATDLVAGPVSGSNIYEANTRTGAQTLVTHQAGSTAAADGVSSEPVIDDDGHLVAYASTADNLIPGQSGSTGVQNVFVWLRDTNANILASGQGGSPTVGGNADSDFPLLTRHSFPGFSSKATNLVPGVGGTSVAYINTLVELKLSPNTVADGTAAGSTVGTLSVSSLLAGQYLPPTYALPAGAADNRAFALGAAASGTAPLVLVVPASYAGQSSYRVQVRVDVGFGPDDAVLQVLVANPTTPTGPTGPTNPPPPPVPQPATARLVTLGRGKKKRLGVVVFDAATGATRTFVSPFQGPTFRHVQVTVAHTSTVIVNGSRKPGRFFPLPVSVPGGAGVVVTAWKGKAFYSTVLPG